MSEKNCCRYKKKPRDPQVKKDVVRRLNRAQGQIGGIRQMVEDERYCSDILIQLAAVQSAIKAISVEVLSEHMHTCVVDEIQEGNVEVVDEVMKLVKKFS